MNGRDIGAGVRQVDPAKRWIFRKLAGFIKHAETDLRADPKPLLQVQEQASDDIVRERI